MSRKQEKSSVPQQDLKVVLHLLYFLIQAIHERAPLFLNRNQGALLFLKNIEKSTSTPQQEMRGLLYSPNSKVLGSFLVPGTLCVGRLLSAGIQHRYAPGPGTKSAGPRHTAGERRARHREPGPRHREASTQRLPGPDKKSAPTKAPDSPAVSGPDALSVGLWRASAGPRHRERRAPTERAPGPNAETDRERQSAPP